MSHYSNTSVVRNVIFNMVSFVFIVGIQFWMVPYIVHSVGVEAYAYVPLSNNFMNIMLILTIAFNSMVARFFTFHMLSGETDKAKAYFSTSFAVSTVFFIVLAPILLVFSLNINLILKIPGNLLNDVKLMFMAISLSFLSVTVRTPFETVFYCKNRFDIKSTLNALEYVIRAALLIVLFKLLSPSLWQTGISYLTAVFSILIITVIVFKRLMPEIDITFKQFKYGLFLQLLKSGGWQSLNHLGTILFLNIDMLVANWYLSPRDAGLYGAVLQLPMMLRSLAGTISTVFAPVYVSYYSKNDILGLERFAVKTQKLFGILMAFLVGMACGFGRPIMLLWLGNMFEPLTLLLWVLIAHLAVNLAVLPLFDLITATNRVKLPGITTPVLGVFNFLLAIALCKYAGLGMYGIALAGFVVLTLKNIVFIPVYCAYILNLPKLTFLKNIIYIIAVFMAIFGLGALVNYFIAINTWLLLFVWGAIVSAVSIGLIYLIGLKKDERAFVSELILSKIKR